MSEFTTTPSAVSPEPLSEPETTDAAYGIRGVLPPGDPMRSPHLLGDDFEWSRWYASETERDHVFADMTAKHPYYRAGDYPSLELSKIQRPEEPQQPSGGG